MERYVWPSFAELSNSLGDIADLRVGDLVRDAAVGVTGLAADAFLDRECLLQWEGWEDLRTTLLMHDAAADAAETDFVCGAICRSVRKLLKIASDYEDAPLKSGVIRLQELVLRSFMCGCRSVFAVWMFTIYRERFTRTATLDKRELCAQEDYGVATCADENI